MSSPKKWIQSEISTLDPYTEYARIWRLLSCYGLNDFMNNLIYVLTFPNFIVTEWGAETIWREDGGKVLDRSTHRVEQTSAANALWWWYGPHDERTKQSVDGINRLHAHWAKQYPGHFSYNDDYVYVCAFSAVTMHRLRLRMGLSGISEKEQIASHLFWREMCKLFLAENGTPISGYPDDFEGLIRFCEGFENTARPKPERGHLATVAMHEQFVFRFFPKELHWLGHQLIRSLSLPTTLETLQIDPPFPLAQEVLPRVLGLVMWYNETQMDDPPRSFVEEREAMDSSEQAKLKATITELDKAFPEHLRALYGDNPTLAGCPFHKALLSRTQTAQHEIGDEVSMLEQTAGLLRM